VKFEVRRRIVGKYGKRYGVDMIGTTAQAASAIALRNAILKGVPKVFWGQQFQAAMAAIRGDKKTWQSRLENLFAQYAELGVEKADVYSIAGVTGADDLKQDHLVQLASVLTGLKDGDVTLSSILSEPEKTEEKPKAKAKPPSPKKAQKPKEEIKPEPKEDKASEPKKGQEEITQKADEESDPDDEDQYAGYSPDQLIEEIETVLSGMEDPKEVADYMQNFWPDGMDEDPISQIAFPPDAERARGMFEDKLEALNSD